MNLEAHQLFSEFIQLYQSSSSIMLSLQGKSYQPFFIYHFIHHLKNNNIALIAQNIDSWLQEGLEQQISLIDSNKTFYWLGDISHLSAADFKKLLPILKAQAASKSIGFYYDNASSALAHDKKNSYSVVNCMLKPLDSVKALLELWKLMSAHAANTSTAMHLAQQVFTRSSSLSLDSACQLLVYKNIISGAPEQFIDQYLPELIKPELSLFKLAELFFARSINQFFSMWATIVPTYPDQFWVAFWSDQLFRAYCYKQAVNAQAPYETIKQASARLPFSFTGKDHRGVALEKLQHAHDALTQVDYNFKNGASSIVNFTLLFVKWFDNE